MQWQRKRSQLAATMTLGVCVLIGHQRLSAADLDDAARSAVYLLEQSVRVRGDGRPNPLLMALRHLRDPLLEPLYDELSHSKHPGLKIQGILGLAEVQPRRGIDLNLLAEIDTPVVQGELVTAALDSELLSDEQAQQILGWPGMDTGVKLLIATPMLSRGVFDDTELIASGLDAEKLGRRGLAALLLHQLGDPAGIAALRALNETQDTQRDPVRAMLLQTALRHDLDAVAGWAYDITVEPDVEPVLGMQALRTAMRFGEERAVALWEQRYTSTTDPARRIRLAMLALQLSPYLEPAVFDVPAADDDPLLRQIGRTGGAIASNGRDLPDQTVALIRFRQPIVNRWALSYAGQEADPASAQLILLGLILAGEANDGNASSQVRRLDDAVLAAQYLYELDPDAAVKLLRPIVADPDADPMLVQAILLALVRTQEPGADRVISGLADFGDRKTDTLALLLRARHGSALTDVQLADLDVLVRGGGGGWLQDTLRIQAAWCYLRHTDQTGRALVEVLAK